MDNQVDDVITNIEEFLDRALSGEHDAPVTLKNTAQRLVAIELRNKYLVISRYFKEMAKYFENQAVKELKAQKRVDFNITIMIYNCNIAKQFYKDEAKMIEDMIKEYNDYILNNHVFSNLFLGRDRDE